MQVHPASTKQVELHPSKETLFPSSQFSLGLMITLSPHMTEHIDGLTFVPPVQYQPVMFPEQSERQPIPSNLMPSSHSSGG